MVLYPGDIVRVGSGPVVLFFGLHLDQLPSGSNPETNLILQFTFPVLVFNAKI